ncbi:MAG: class I SAM-dependent methyltransferase, partial [Myxococcota bacterium]
IRVICGDISKIPLDPPQRYDVIFFPDGDGVHYQVDRQKLFDRLAHVAADGCRLVGSFYVPGKGLGPSEKAAFDQSMTWAGFTPSGVNAESYEQGLLRAGFDPGPEAGSSMVRTHVNGLNVPEAYLAWHTRVRENQVAQGRSDAWLEDSWLKPAKQAPNGFGFILDAVIRHR